MSDDLHLHRLFGEKKSRINYHAKDFLDYMLMLVILALALACSYGIENPLGIAGLVLCGYMVFAFVARHGIEIVTPVIFKKPADVLYMLIYKLMNLKAVYFVALAVLLIENLVIYLTPNLNHKTELMRTIGLYLFYIHFVALTIYRTVILIAHLLKRSQVMEVLSQSTWKWAATSENRTVFEIFHAYFTGILTHIVALAPWFLVIGYFQFSVLFLAIAIPINIFTQIKFYGVINRWFYRDHWLGHNSELEFVYLHGSHHDAIPSGMIAVGETGFLEGFLRNIIGYPNPFYNPVAAFLLFSSEIKTDIDTHQYIPGIFPRMSYEFLKVSQHATHHFGRLDPYGFAVKLDQPGVSPKIIKQFKISTEELKNSAKLDEKMGFEWDNSRYKWYLKLVEKYQN